MAYIYHLISPKEWEKALNSDSYKPADFQKEGFIHFSSEEQVIPSANKHYKDHDSLVLLVVSEKRVKKQLKWEKSRNDELFPHLYSKLSLEWIETSYMLSRNPKGEWEWEGR